MSGFSLALSLVFIVIGSAFVWIYLFCSLCGKENGRGRIALVSSIASIVYYFPEIFVLKKAEN